MASAFDGRNCEAIAVFMSGCSCTRTVSQRYVRVLLHPDGFDRRSARRPIAVKTRVPAISDFDGTFRPAVRYGEAVADE